MCTCQSCHFSAFKENMLVYTHIITVNGDLYTPFSNSGEEWERRPEHYLPPSSKWGFPGSSAGKESACSAGDHSLIPGSGRSPEEGIGYPLQYSWASLVAQLVKNLPAMWKTWIQSLGWKDPLEKGEGTHSSILAWRIPWTVQPMGLQRVRHD